MSIRRETKVGRGVLRLVLLFFVGLAESQSGPIRVVGSDLLGENFNQVLADFAKEQGLAIEVNLKGSLPGRLALESGQAEVGLISLAPGESDLGPEYSMKPLAYHIAVLQVRRDLALE